MTTTPDPMGASGPLPDAMAWSEPVRPPPSAGLDPYAELDRDALRVTIQHREADLAGAREELYATRNELATTALDLRICREALEHREADLFKAREELNTLLERHAYLALDKDILEGAIGDREADLASARRDAAAAIEQSRRSEERMSVLEAEVRALQDAAQRASIAPAQAMPEALSSAMPIEGRTTSNWEDFKFLLSFMFNVSNSHSAEVDPIHRTQGSDGTMAETDPPVERSTRRENR